MKALKVSQKPFGFFPLPVEGVEKSRWEISSKPLDTLEKAVWFFCYPFKSLRKAIGKVWPSRIIKKNLNETIVGRKTAQNFYNGSVGARF